MNHEELIVTQSKTSAEHQQLLRRFWQVRHKACERCGTSYVLKVSNQKFCSWNCYLATYNERRRTSGERVA